jgi:hypothetical protein
LSPVMVRLVGEVHENTSKSNNSRLIYDFKKRFISEAFGIISPKVTK